MTGGAIDQALLRELRDLYARVDAAYADWSCPGSTECCRFGVTGRQPYVTSIELALLQRAVAARGGPLRPERRALPLRDDPERERACPLLDRNRRCGVYAERPLGCRTFYCDRAERGSGPDRAQLRDFVQELKDIAERHRMGGAGARPLERVF